MRATATMLFAGLLLVQICTAAPIPSAEAAKGEKDVQNLNEDFYASFGFEKYDPETDKVADTRAQLPTLEEQREEEANKRGWFDPRFSRRWDTRKPEAQQPQEVNKAPAAQQPAAEKKPEAPKAEAPKVEAPKSEEKKAEAPKSEAPKSEEKKVEAPKSEEKKVEAPKSEEKKVDAPKAEAPKSDNKAAEPVPAPEKFKQWPSLEQERESDANSRGWFDPRYSQKWKWNSAYAESKKPSKVSA